MNLPDGRPVVVHEGILAEAGREGDRVVLWVPGEEARGFRHWERVGTVPHAGMILDRGIRAVPATSVPARQRVSGGLGKLLRRLGGPGEVAGWTVPGGEQAERCGDRRADLLLAWPEDDATAIDAERARALWGDGAGARALGPHLYLISGVKPARPVANPAPDPATSSDSPVDQAGSALALAREVGDAARLSVALADLGLAWLQAGDAARASAPLEEAVVEGRRSGDAAKEIDASVALGLALLASAGPEKALGVLGPALARARDGGFRFAEKAALDHLGQCHMALGDAATSLGHFERALAIASEVGDATHEAELLWRVGLQHAELGRRDRALAMTGAAVERMRRQGRPQAEWYAHHREQYRSAQTATATPGPGVAVADPAAAWSTTVDASVLGMPATPPPARGPGPLRMALSAIGSMAKFLGSGFRVADPALYRQRLDSCGGCEHHTGLRCRACGCFTAAKARLYHERCPLGRWRA